MRDRVPTYSRIMLTRYHHSVGDALGDPENTAMSSDPRFQKDYSQYIDLASQAVTGLFGAAAKKKALKQQQKELEAQAKVAAVQAQQQMQMAALQAQAAAKKAASKAKTVGYVVGGLGLTTVLVVLALRLTRK